MISMAQVFNGLFFHICASALCILLPVNAPLHVENPRSPF